MTELTLGGGLTVRLGENTALALLAKAGAEDAAALATSNGAAQVALATTQATNALASASIYDRIITGQRNLFNKARVTAGKGLNISTGAETTSAGSNVSHLIPVVGSAWYSSGTSQSTANVLQTIWLDDTGTFISGVAAGTAGPYQAPSNAAFAKVAVADASLATASFEPGKLRSPYQTFDETLADNFKYRTVPNAALAALVAKKNMVDPSRLVADYYVNTGANAFLFSSNSTFNLLLPVPCNGSTTYYSNKTHYWACYDANMGKLTSGSNVAAGSFTTHADAVWLASSVSDANLSGWQIEESSVGGTAYEAFNLVLNPDLLPDLAPYLPAAEEPPSPYYGRDLLRQCHARLDFLENRSRVAVVQKLAIGFVGDSYINGVGYFISLLADYLQDKYGFGGQGFTSAGWYASGSGSYTDGGTQPSSMAGSIYGPTGINLIADPVIHGTWTNSPRDGANNTPDIGKIVSTTAGNYVRFTYIAGHDTAKAFFHDNGAGTGVIRYKWNSGSWSSNVTLGSGVTVETLTGMPSTAGTLTIEVVSGSVGISGVSFTQEATSGVVLHKLAASGSNSAQWAAMTPATWGAAVAGGLGLHAMVVMLGTNDGMLGTPTTPNALAANVATIMNAGLLSRPGMDCLAVAPMETPSSSNTQSAASYATALRSTCVSEMFAFMDLQPLVQKGTHLGEAVDTTTYDDANAEFPAMSTDDIHPSVTTLLGGAAMRYGFRQMMEP